MGDHGVADRVDGLQIGEDGLQIAVGDAGKTEPRHVGVVGVVHFRRRAGGVFPELGELIEELLLGPAADARLLIGSEVGADDTRVGGKLKLVAAGEIAALDGPSFFEGRVAESASGNPGEVFSRLTGSDGGDGTLPTGLGRKRMITFIGKLTFVDGNWWRMAGRVLR